MSILRVRRILGFGWFYLVTFFTAAVVVSTDSQIGNLTNALTRHLPTVFVFSLPLVLTVLPSLLLFLRRQWVLGVAAASIGGVVLWSGLQLLQTNAPTLNETLSLLPWFVLVCGIWATLVTLPAALLLRSNTPQT